MKRKMDTLTIIKVGGKIVEEPETLSQLLSDFSKIQGLNMNDVKEVFYLGGKR